MDLAEAYLTERGLSRETAFSAGIEIDNFILKEHIIERLGKDFAYEGKPLSQVAETIIWFPVRNSRGIIISWIARPLPTLKNVPKFLTPLGGTAPPYIPKYVYENAVRPATPLIITEGPVKAMACVEAGFAAIGLSGAWCAAQEGPGKKLVLRSELRDFDWRGRPVYVCFDADAAVKPDVRHASIRLFMLLSQQAAEVYQLTAWNLAKGKGIDDLLVGEARADLTREKILENLVENAVPFVNTITKTKVDLDAVRHELIKVHLDPIFRVRLCKELARKCDVPVDLLRRLGGEETKETATILGFNEVLEPWPGPVNGAELHHDLAAIIKRHIVLDNDSAAAVALWIVLTYVSHVVDTLPILAITSPEKRCGKSRLLSVLLRLVYQPMACVDITPAALFRSIEKWHPTLLVDEADTFLKENVELRGIINSGHTRDQAWVPRCVGDEKDVQMFSTWAPKSIALIGELPSTLRDRSIQISMKRRARGEVVVPLRKTPKTEFDILRRKILRWVLDKAQLIETIEPSLPDTLNDRAADNWLPLVAIAVAAGEDWPEIARSALINLSASEDEEDSVMTALLAALRRLFKERNMTENDGFLPTDEILKKLNADKEAPWAGWRQGNGISAERLASFLRRFGIRSSQKRLKQDQTELDKFQLRQEDEEKSSRPRGYYLKSLLPIFDRYLSPLRSDDQI